MNNNAFERHWSKFSSTVKNRLTEKSKVQKITLQYANLILNDTLLMWEDDTEECGLWLKLYVRKVPDKGGLIKNVIENNVRFYEIKERKGISDALKGVIAVLGAIAGFAAAYFLGVPLWAKILLTVLPAVIIFSILSVVQKNKNKANIKADIEDYLSQLDIYKNNILDILIKM